MKFLTIIACVATVCAVSLRTMAWQDEATAPRAVPDTLDEAPAEVVGNDEKELAAPSEDQDEVSAPPSDDDGEHLAAASDDPAEKFEASSDGDGRKLAASSDKDAEEVAGSDDEAELTAVLTHDDPAGTESGKGLEQEDGDPTVDGMEREKALTVSGKQCHHSADCDNYRCSGQKK